MKLLSGKQGRTFEENQMYVSDSLFHKSQDKYKASS
jgi:hypothetical protein